MASAISSLRGKISENNLDALLISSIPNIIYLTGFSSFSKDEREAYLLITKTSNYIFTDGRYSEAVSKTVKDFKLIEISSSLSLSDSIKKIVGKQKLIKVGVEEDNLTVSEYKKFKNIFKKTVDFNVNEIRIIKSEDEIKKIEKACKIGDLTYSHILKKLRIGITEKEIATELEFFIKRRGAEISFEPIVAFGANSSVPHHQTSNTKLRKNQIVLLDFGAKFEKYCSDMTRTVIFGKATAEQKKIYQTVLVAQQKAIDTLKLNVNLSNTDEIARKYIVDNNFPTIPHSVGHGIGLEVHEDPHLSPKSKDRLKVGMVFSVEPGIYIKNFGGVRIEDVLVLTKKGPKLLTHSKKELIEL